MSFFGGGGGAFGQNAQSTMGSAFGGGAFGQQPAQQQQPAFGGFGQPQASAFGAPAAAPAFGFGQTTSAFGAQAAAPAFGGNPSTGGFSSFGSTGSAFGANPAQPAGFGFGQTSSPFGAPAANPSNPFGQPSQAGFGFGQTAPAQTGGSFFGGGGFGANTGVAPTFGASSSAFGVSSGAAPGFGGFGNTAQQAAPPGTPNTSVQPYEATKGPDGTGTASASTQGNYMSITHMNTYANYSFEELRVGDYMMNRKKKDNAAGGTFGATSTFGAAQQQNPFGQTQATPAFGSTPFGNTGAAFGGFGQTQSAPAFGGGGFGAATGSAFGGFGASTGAANPFGAKPAAPFGGGFGQSQSGSLFGASTGGAFGSPATSSPFGASTGGGFGGFGASTGGAFGAAAKPATGFGGFGQTQATPFGSSPFGASTGGGFGAPATSSGFGGFGASTGAANPFGAKPAAPFGGGFGQSQSGSLFGASTGGAFGSPATSSPFGASTGGGFGGFGASTGGAFGAAAKPATGFGGFGQTQATPFGSSPFGASTGGGFGAPATSSGFGGFGAATGGSMFGQPASPFGAQPTMQVAQAPPVQVVLPQTQAANTSWMADVQSNPYGNLKLRPSNSETAPRLFSSDPHAQISSDTGNNSPLRSSFSQPPHAGLGGTFRARAAGSNSASRGKTSIRPTRIDGSLSLSGPVPSGQIRPAKASPSPGLISSSTPSLRLRPSAGSWSTKFSEMLERKESSNVEKQLFQSESPAVGKENDNLQASTRDNVQISDGMRNPSSFAPEDSASNNVNSTPNARGNAPFSYASSHQQAFTPVGSSQGPLANDSLLPSKQYNSMMFADATQDGIELDNSIIRDAEKLHSDKRTDRGSEDAWSIRTSDLTFTASREPQDLIVPRGLTITQKFPDGEVEIEFLQDYDLRYGRGGVLMGDADGTGGGAVARILARHVKIEGATSVDISELRALVAVRMTSSKLGQYISSRERLEKVKNQWTEALKQENWTVPEDGFSYDEMSNCLSMKWVPS
ncbi:Nup96-98, nuclear pore complex component [Guillardia theta CCMP2712]|uniref:Nup96-98, nuclear pore complex component n=1 Tax=Guillardia theta (strain CCMP2712) TaxID=905079 RepID=L1IUE7_GUITC|nr:Nup96-98, nuclear pore complex component [Guillardia theta CCMP2712]EKX39465.1 Nup96-98, nuclear pore complex component [Guillardia theta CCMP2712]|eukprot:XP_005826445.1 Nup96-98, nuclear pore complex component [Guillardia theta CCMP2712]